MLTLQLPIELPGSHAAPFRDLLAFLAFVAVGVVLLAVPFSTIVLLGLVIAAVLYVRKALLTTVILAIALVPMRTIFDAGPMESSTTVIVRNIEAGDLERRIAILALFALGLICIIRRLQELRRVNLLPWIGMFLGLAAASTLWSQSASLTMRRCTIAFGIVVFTVGAGSLYFGRKPEGHVRLIRTICWGSFAVSLLTLALAIVRGNFHVLDIAWRLGSNGHENQISWVAGVGFLAAWVTRARRDFWPSRVVSLAVTTIPGVVLLLTKSRTTLLAVVAGILVAELFHQRSRMKKFAVLLFLASALAMFVASPWVGDLLRRGATQEQFQTASGRTELWERLWPLVRQSPWLGHGYGGFWSPRMVTAVAEQWSPTSAHNGYLDMVLQLGLAGLLIIVIFLGVSSKNAWRLMRYPEYYETGLTLLVLNAMFLVLNAAESFAEAVDSYPMMEILICSFFVAYRLRILNETQPLGPPRRPGQFQRA